ncbi:MAG: ScpA family protein [Pseudomonadota bacterium]
MHENHERSPEVIGAEAFVVDVDGFEGPLDMLLTLARTQKVDLRKISVLALAEQYLAFVEEAKRLRLELAADYLVMAAWLAYLKSRLLLPPDAEEEGPSAEDLAAHLAFQLERLEAMRGAAARLMGRDQLGRDFFARGLPENVERRRIISYKASILDLMQAYARISTRESFKPLHLDERNNVFTMEEALARMKGLIGSVIDWRDLKQFLPDGWKEDANLRRSATASTFAATLEMAKAGMIEIRQAGLYDPIEIKMKDRSDG